MTSNPDDATVKQKIIDLYGEVVGEKLFQIIKELSPATKKQLEEAVKGELGEEQAAKIDYDVLMQWISIG